MREAECAQMRGSGWAEIEPARVCVAHSFAREGHKVHFRVLTPTRHGGVSTTFQSCQNLAMAAVSPSLRLSSGECRFEVSAPRCQPRLPTKEERHDSCSDDRCGV